MYDIEGPMHERPFRPTFSSASGSDGGSAAPTKYGKRENPPTSWWSFPAKRTYREALDANMALYARMGIPAYFLYES